MVEILGEVENLEVDEALEAVGKGAEAVEADVEDAEGGHVGGRLGEEGELIAVDGQLLEIGELEAHGLRQLP